MAWHVVIVLRAAKETAIALGYLFANVGEEEDTPNLFQSTTIFAVWTNMQYLFIYLFIRLARLYIWVIDLTELCKEVFLCSTFYLYTVLLLLPFQSWITVYSLTNPSKLSESPETLLRSRSIVESIAELNMLLITVIYYWIVVLRNHRMALLEGALKVI